ncbi:MAG: hypothetical protein NT069_01710 [Planctomycetota bacterium]|nr:hypothetical protein [Planctomycetota bacterium]
MADPSIFLEDNPEEPVRPKARARSESLPVLVIVVMIMELIACATKLFGVLSAVLIAVGIIPEQQAQLSREQLIAGAVVNVLVFLTALPAAIGILRKRPWGLTLGWIAAVVGAIGAVIGGVISIQQIDKLSNLPTGLPPDVMRIIMLVVTGVTQVLSLAYIITHCMALVKYGKWLADRQGPQGPQGEDGDR